MTADELQNWARLLRWVGLAVTAIGLALTSPAFRKDDTLLNRKPGGLMEQSNASLQRGDQG
jgi:hypothetical protein